jgi:hypothetical protein
VHPRQELIGCRPTYGLPSPIDDLQEVVLPLRWLHELRLGGIREEREESRANARRAHGELSVWLTLDLDDHLTTFRGM